MNSVLITGGMGFIGSHLADTHIQKGDKVHVIDDLSTGDLKNIQHLKNHRRFGYSVDTVLNQKLLLDKVGKADFVYHLAAVVGVKLVIASPIRAIETNAGATAAVLRACGDKKKKVLIASSSEVYGKSDKVPFHEDDDLWLGPPSVGRWAYAAGKVVDECLAAAYFKEKKCSVVVARLFNVIGPRQVGAYGMVVPCFIDQALSGRDLEVYGSGKQRRCFVHVRDAVEMMARLIGERKCMGQIFNVGSAEEVEIMTLARKIKKLCRSASRIQKVPYQKAYGNDFEDMTRRMPSLEKLKKFLGRVPHTSLDRTLKEIIAQKRL